MKITQATYKEYAQQYLDYVHGNIAILENWEGIRDTLKEYHAILYHKPCKSLEVFCDWLIKHGGLSEKPVIVNPEDSELVIPDDALFLTNDDGKIIILKPDEDIIVTSKTVITSPITINAQSIQALKLHTHGVVTTLMSTGNVLVDTMTITGVIHTGSTGLGINTSEDIVVKNCVFDYIAMNGLELCHFTQAKNILIENCIFSGVFTDSGITIFGQAEDCTITIKDCIFSHSVVPLLLQNNDNTHVTVNLENCVFLNHAAVKGRQGIVFLRNMFDKSDEDIYSNKRFNNDKIILNVLNCSDENGVMYNPLPESYCGTLNEHQLIGQYASAYDMKYIPYSSDMYPVINWVKS